MMIDFKKCDRYARLLSREEKNAWALPEEMTVSEWADKFRVLGARVSSEPGPWVTVRTPYLREIMDSLSDPAVRQVTFKKPVQVGGTEVGLNFLGWVIGQAPGPVLVVQPTLELAKRVSRRRIWPLVMETESLEIFLPTSSDDISRLYYQLLHMDIRLAGAESPAALASDPIQYLILDEVNKYQSFTGKEADPISLAKDRQTTYKHEKKTYVTSTPTIPDAQIEVEFEASDQRRYYVPCPHCHAYQTLKWEQVKFDSKEKPQKIRKGQLAHYECKICNWIITDKDKSEMLQRGVWAPKGCTINKQGKIEGVIPQTDHRGYWINAIYSPWLSFADMAAEWVAAQGKPEKLMDFINAKLAEAWKETVEETSEDQIRHLIGDFPKDFCPAGTEVLIGEVDVQKDYFILAIRAWGMREENWLIHEERLEVWSQVENVLFRTQYEGVNGKKFEVRLAAIDTGHRTSEVYAFCSKWPHRTMAVKGQEDMGGPMMRPNKLEKFPDGSTIPGGLILWHVNNFYYNDKSTRFMCAKPGEIGEMHFHRTVSDEYLRQLCSEHKVQERDKKGRVRLVWKMRPGYGQNHYRDCARYGLAAADLLKIAYLRPPDQPTGQDQGRPKDSKKDDFIGAGSDFIEGEEDFIGGGR